MKKKSKSQRLKRSAKRKASKAYKQAMVGLKSKFRAA